MKELRWVTWTLLLASPSLSGCMSEYNRQMANVDQKWHGAVQVLTIECETFEQGAREIENSRVSFDKAWVDIDLKAVLKQHTKDGRLVSATQPSAANPSGL